MYCPNCGTEYREGVTTCSDCNVPLTPDPPTPVAPDPRPEWLDLETILETSDSALLPVVRSLLESEGIPCFVRGEQLQEFLGWGRMPSGVNLITGPMQLQVPRERLEEARQLLRVMRGSGSDTLSDEPLDE